MRAHDLHLLFHPETPETVYRLECRVPDLGVGLLISVGVSDRLKEAVRAYDAHWRACAEEPSEPDNELLDILTVWIGRLLWDNFFAGADGSPNPIGQALLATLDQCQADGAALRLMLHLGQHVGPDSTLARIPWASLLCPKRWGDRGWEAIISYPGVNGHILHYWPHPRLPRRVDAAKRQFDVVLTYGGDQGGASDIATTAQQIRDWLNAHRSDFHLVSEEQCQASLQPVKVDLHMHVAHGNLDAVTGATTFYIYDTPNEPPAMLGPYGFRRLQSGFDAAMCMLIGCSAGSPGPHAGVTLARRLLATATHVIGFPVPVPPFMAADLTCEVLAHLQRGRNIEDAVAHSRSLYHRRDRPSYRMGVEVPVRWEETLLITHVGTRETPEEFDLLGDLATTLAELEPVACERQHELALEENLGNPACFIAPRGEKDAAAIPEVQSRVGLSKTPSPVSALPLLLMGEAGIGKTTFLHQLFTETYTEFKKSRAAPQPTGERELLGEHPLPLLLTCKALQEARAALTEPQGHTGVGGSLPVYRALAQLLFHAGGDKADAVERLLIKGRLLLMLDGLDEVVDLADLQALRDWAQFLRPLFQNPNARVIVACREELARMRDLDDPFPKGSNYRLRPWAKEHLQDYFAKYRDRANRPLDTKRWDEFLQRGQAILSTPLFAHLAAEFLAQEQSRPDQQPASDDVFWVRTLQSMTERWAQRESRKARIAPEALLEVARHAAHALSCNLLTGVNIRRLGQDINQSLMAKSDPQLEANTLDVLALHSLLYVEHGVARFAHPLFQTFFAAQYLADRLAQTDDSLQDVRQYRSAPPPEVVETVARLLFLAPLRHDLATTWSATLKERMATLSGALGTTEDHNREASLFCQSFILPICSYLDQQRLEQQETQQ
ncbi:MAG: NACHT domain-containing protein, partial [Nitrospinae bacterium]|nr:NACHT domain-containing protein [Nitrospinota bacterium]